MTAEIKFRAIPRPAQPASRSPPLARKHRAALDASAEGSRAEGDERGGEEASDAMDTDAMADAVGCPAVRCSFEHEMRTHVPGGGGGAR